MKHFALLLLGLVSYLIGLGTLVVMLFWLYPWSWMPTTIDSGTPRFPALLAVAVDVGLIALFGLQHSLMVRPGFKRWFERYVPAQAQRSLYTLASAVTLAAILLFWQLLPGTVWDFRGGIGFWAMTLLYFLGWGIAVAATFQIDHFGLFGLTQAWRAFHGIPEPPERFQEKGFYRFVRHPIQAGTLLGLWATPHMSTGHLLFAAAFTLYILIGLHFEEKDLIKTLGKPYIDYRKRVPMLFPLRIIF
ncbi:methyltransferase family protein [Hydrogenimonas urashimensis]|uniref:methyltransferase family protein n=1 Tax=Hydrogenimonas urashimensis TaxID=2740515 RepID=UPI001914DAA0|nr:isoprenylcysteine carboxylmethyltransferase family protein [Hydrogenimonas urashimensis]